jgi:hypothetical protein
MVSPVLVLGVLDTRESPSAPMVALPYIEARNGVLYATSSKLAISDLESDSHDVVAVQCLVEAFS